MHLTYGPHQSSTPTTSPLLLCSSQTVTLLHCRRLLLLVIAPVLPQLVSIPPPLLSPRRNAAVNTAAGVVFFPLRLSRPSLGGDIMISHSQGSFQRDSAGSYRPTQASGFHGWERPNIAGGLSCTAWRSPCFWLLHIGGFRLYTLRRAQPLSMCRHTGAGHSCHRFRLHDRRTPLPFSGA